MYSAVASMVSAKKAAEDAHCERAEADLKSLWESHRDNREWDENAGKPAEPSGERSAKDDTNSDNNSAGGGMRPTEPPAHPAQLRHWLRTYADTLSDYVSRSASARGERIDLEFPAEEQLFTVERCAMLFFLSFPPCADF
jgi:hypothetical protein